MSSYLNIYLVPKKTKKVYDCTKNDGTNDVEIEISKGLPLFFTSYSRNSEVYQAYNDTLHPAYCNNEDKYTTLTYEDAQSVVHGYEKEIEVIETRLNVCYKMLKEGGYSSELFEEIQSTENYLQEQRETLSELQNLSNIVHECLNSWSDFEKVVININ